jgi:aminoglycoside phosphotransferase family enzyme/predicted kinase
MILGGSVAVNDRQRPVNVVETHISWVFLTERFAYKLKKPVKFEFLDFSTVELRRKACQAEIQLNRRMARTVYLEALQLTRNANGRLEFSATAPPIDWVVKMRRLPAEKSLAVLLANDRLTANQAERIAGYLARFYTSLPPALVRPEVYCRALFEHIRSNAAALSGTFPEIRRASSALLRYLALQSEEFAGRVVAGRVVDGHGDLRPDHVYAEDPPVVIDCVEFSEELRRVDVADELAFLDMECQRLGDDDFGKLVIAEYQRLSSDDIPRAVQSFYRGYRACVRGKVAHLRSTQQPNNARKVSAQAAKEYLDLANQFAAALGPPALVIVGGLPGTGKSTLAMEVAATLDCDVISTDCVRRDLLGPSPALAEYGEGRYEVGARQEIYRELFQQAARELSNGLSLVLDGTFSRRELRDKASAVAAERGAICLLVHCRCPPEIALERIIRREQEDSSASETRPGFYARQASEFQLPDDSHSVIVETTLPLSDQMQVVREELKRRLFQRGSSASA